MEEKPCSSSTGTVKEFPKRLLRHGSEPEVRQINNNCKMSILNKIEDALPSEYKKVKEDPLFAHVLKIHENGLGYSGRLIHIMMCRQLVTRKKHELWFVFGNKPLRFSLQEFYAVTGLKYKDDFSYDLESWTNDGGFWSRLLERDDKICIKTLLNKHLVAVHTWEKVDRIRFIYLCVIAGLVMARDEKKDIPTLYIKLVMDLEKLRAYPWGLHSYDYLVKSITKVKTDLKKEVSYPLNGFSLALQIWAMEAIPSIQFLFGHKLNKELGAVPRCSNWKGLARVSYYQISLIENSMTAKDIVYPYISITGNYDVHESADFMRLGEKKDEAIKNLNNLIRSGFDFAEFEWEDIEIDAVEEKKIEEENIEEEKIDQPLDEDKYVEGQTDTHSDDKEAANVTDGGNIVTGLRRRHKKQPTCSKKRKKEADRGAESRKMRLLCQRAATTTGFDEGMKSFIKEMFETSFMQFGQEINKRLEKVQDDVSSLKDDVSSLKETVTAMAETSTKEKARSFKSKAVDENCMFDEYITQTGDIDLNCNLTTQDFLQREMGHLSQKTQVPDFDQSQGLFREDVVPRQRHNYSSEFLDWRCKGDSGKNDVDAVLVYLSEAKWDAFTEWQMNLSREDPKLGPSLLTNALFERVINPKNWLGNHEIDAMLFLHREKTSIGRLQLDRVGFMNCMFSTRIKTEYERYLKNKKSHKWDSRLLSYVYGENPSHGMTCKRWAMDVDRIYAPVNINNSHWISICINFALRTIEVFDCNAGHTRRYVEPFAYTIPRILKEVHSKVYGKVPLLTQYEIIPVKVPPALNSSQSHCGVYALKYIECHMLGLDMDLITDENIQEARMKIAVDLWEASNDPVLIERMKNYKPPQLSSETIEID